MTINIALTSYPRRITNCVSVINSILENTVQPDRVYLTLSSQEFPNYEQSIPEDLYRLVLTSDKVILNWVEDNYKSMKKVFPILKYLEDDDIIIDIDDDMNLPKDFIASRMEDFKKYGEKHPITSNINQTVNMDNMVMSCYSLFQKKMLNGYEKFVNNTVLNTFNDDRTYLYLCHLNGYKLMPCTKWCVNAQQGNATSKLPIAPHGNYNYLTGCRYDSQLAQTIRDISNGKKINDCFGLFKWTTKEETPTVKGKRTFPISSIGSIEGKESIYTDTKKIFQYDTDEPIKHDVVYVLGTGSKHNNLEIKISITSLLKFCNHWIGNIYVVGVNPRIFNPRVKHIQAPDITKCNKDANIIYKLNWAIKSIPTLSENFLFCSDDILVTKKTDWEDFVPRYVFEYNQNEEFRKRLYEESKGNAWDRLLLKTLDRFVGIREHIYFWEPHIFAPINKKLFRKMCSQIDYTKQRNIIIMSLWFNWLDLKNPPRRFDHQSAFSSEIPDMNNLERHLTYNDSAFGVKEFRDKLIEHVTMDFQD